MKVKLYVYFIFIVIFSFTAISPACAGLPLQWATYYGGGGEDYATYVATDDRGNVYVGGNTKSINNITTPGTFMPIPSLHHPLDYGYVAKFNNAGTRLWGTYIPGQVYSVACDQSGNVYATGKTTNQGWVSGTGVHQPNLAGGNDAFIVKLNNTGGLVWATYYGGPDDDFSYSIKVDPNNDVYIAGVSFSGTGIATPGTHKPTLVSAANFFLTKFDANGARMWGTYLGSNSGAESPEGPAISLAVDLSGYVYLSGKTKSIDGIATPNAQQSVHAGDFDAFLVKFDPTGSRVWGTYFGGTGDDRGTDIVCDYEGNIYMGGYTTSSMDIATPGTWQIDYKPDPKPGGNRDYNMFLAKFNNRGFQEWGTYYRDLVNLPPHFVSYYILSRVAYDPSGYVYLGTCRSTDVNTTGFNAYDAHLARFDGTNGWLDFDTTFGGAGDAEFTGGIATDSSGNVFLAGFTNNLTNLNDLATPGSHQTMRGSADDGFLAKYLSADTSVYFRDLLGITTTVCHDDTFSLPYGVTYSFNPGNEFTAQLYDTLAGLYFDIGTVVRSGSGSILCKVADSIPLGTYKIRIFSTNVVDTTAENDVTITVSKGFSLEIVGDTLVCSGQQIRLNAVVFPPMLSRYTWIGPNSFSSGDASPTVNNVVMQSAGDYVVEVTNLQGGCATRDTLAVVVKPSPEAPVVTLDTAICERDTLFLEAVSATLGATYHWRGPNGFMVDTNETKSMIPYISLQGSGTYAVAARFDGCISDTVLTSVRVKRLPVFSVSGSSPICEDDTMVLFAQSDAPDSTLRWEGPNGFAADSSYVLVRQTPYNNRGEYRIFATLEGCTAYSMINIDVKPKPKFLADNNGPLYEQEELQLLIADEQFPGAEYSWVGPDSFRSNVKEPRRPWAADSMAGVYHVRAVLDGCVYTGLTTVIVYKLNNKVFKLYPSPNNGNFFVEGRVLYDQEILFEIASSANQTIGKDVIFTQNRTFKVEMMMEDQLANGTYYFRALVNGEWKVIPFTIMK